VRSSSATSRVPTPAWGTASRGPTTYEALIHALGCKTPCITRELLDIATQYSTNEEAI
jgi:hypothetical protein